MPPFPRPIDSGVRHEVVRGLQIVWLAFLGGVGLYTLLLMLLSSQSDTADGTLGDTLRPIFWVLAALLAIVSLIWRQVVADIDHRQQTTNTRGFTRLRVACLITWALCEGIAILGIALGFVTHQFTDYFPFVVVAIVMLFLHRPTNWPIERFLRQELG